VEPATPREASVAYQLPPISLLNKVPPDGRKGIQADTGITGRILVDTLKEFGIDAQVTNVEQGPVVTRYELLPAPGIRVERISGLSNNLALSLNKRFAFDLLQRLFDGSCITFVCGSNEVHLNSSSMDSQIVIRESRNLAA